MEKAFELVCQLVKDFKAQETAYLSPAYQESQVRQDFIDKFFTALGWDVTHTVQKNPYRQEVKIENRIATSGSQRRADYAFFLAPNFHDVKFFVEAKKPSHDLANAGYYHQAIRYGWNAGTPIAILTDFQEFHILDCRYKPDIATALDRKIDVLNYTAYADEEEFKKIFYLFGREAVANGSLEEFAAGLPKPKGKAKQPGAFKSGYQQVDEAFLEELDGYRQTLAKAFKKANASLEGEELTEAVQRTIDRLVFIRFLEDKGIEDASIINFRSQKSAWNAFLTLCKRLEPKYNGLVFKPHKILDGREFNPPDDKTVAQIFSELSDPASPYDFNQIPISILGSIYERFLGKVVHATAKQVKIEEKPEVRKAGGVYYTPQYIVRYIVNETVGKLIEGKTPKEIAGMAFADIACGSGSFLIEVYGRLLDYHVQWYTAHPDQAKPAGKDKAENADFFTREGKLQLTLKKKKEILLNNIYGVDIDFQATEVTQLSLYLKMLEDATLQETLQLGLFKEQILPDLKQNIVCGNSLIGRDILDGNLFDDGMEHELKPMNFYEMFPKVFEKGGFDAVVGNPPYGVSFSMAEKAYLKSKYSAMVGKYDSYGFFIERALSLQKYKGILGYIVPHTWLTVIEAKSLRALILEKTCINSIVRLPSKVFKDATVNAVLLFLRNEYDEKVRDNNILKVCLFDADKTLDDISESNAVINSIQQSSWNSETLMFNINISPEAGIVIKKISFNATTWDKIADFCVGVQAYDVYAGQKKEVIKNRAYHADSKKDDTYVKELNGSDVSRYMYKWQDGSWISYGPWLAHPRQPEFFEGSRILVREITDKGKYIIHGAYTEDRYVNYKTILNIKLKPVTLENGYKYSFFLGILNSSLMSFYFLSSSNKLVTNTFPRISILDMKRFPMRLIDFKDPKDKARHDNIAKLVEQMLATKEKLAASKTDAESNRLELQCAALDKQIDAAVYELYGLTDEEIRVVEGK